MKRLSDNSISFSDYPEFKPNLTPKEIFELGSFGGTYWRPIHSAVTGRDYHNVHKEYPWFKDIPDRLLITDWNHYDKSLNKYKVKVGTTLDFWESSGWISEYNVYGWVHWYCDFYSGKRCPDDSRQVKRWIQTAGPNSRFRKRLINMIKAKNSTYNDYSISPAIRQTLQHWGYQLTEKDLN